MTLRLLALALSISLLSSCSGDGGGPAQKNLGLTISGSRSFNTDIIHGQIDHYRLTVTGPDINKEITQDFGGASEAAQMGGVPVGTDRTITVEAINPNGVVIRRGKVEGVTITAGVFSELSIVMHSVPIFTNVTDKSAVAGRRLGLEIFGEPGSELEILTRDSGAEEIMTSRSAGKALVDTSKESGLFVMDPLELTPGLHTFCVRDRNTQEITEVTFTIYDHLTRPGISINAGGVAKQMQDELVLSGAGQPYFNEVYADNIALGNTALLDVVELLY